MGFHPDPHPLAGQTVILNDRTSDPHRQMVEKGEHFRIEDWVDRLDLRRPRSWTDMGGNWAAVHYGTRVVLTGLPLDDEVVYGKIDGYGHIVHVSELGSVVDDA